MIIIRVTICDDITSDIQKEFCRTFDERSPWEMARSIRAMMHRIFQIVFGHDNEEWT